MMGSGGSPRGADSAAAETGQQDARGASASRDSFDSLLEDIAHVSTQPAAPGSALPAGSKLAGGRLTIVRQLGRGGMGVVYEARDGERRQAVALKTLNRLGAAEIYRLKNEFRALADVTHAHLAQLYELFSADESWFFTMELVDGERFDRWLRPGGALAPERMRPAFAQLASAVRAIHAAGKLHRDLKPSNVLVTAAGRVVVLDFGLAVAPELGGVGQTVSDDSVSGTPAYMAPEQAAGRDAGEASDWYAVGVMLYEALTGRLPFEGRIGEILAHKQVREASPPSALAAGVPPDLDRLCARLLAREPAARAGAAEVLAAVGDAPPPDGSLAPSIAPPEQIATPLLGRDAELAALHDAYRASSAGQKPVIVLLAGESGIGKSSLCERFLQQLREAEPVVALSGRCYERESVPFKAFDAVIDALSRHLRRQGRDAAALLPRDVWALRRLFPVLGRIEAVAEAPEREAADQHDLRRRGFAALGELLGRIRDRGPLVLYIDDLQWSDADSTVLLMHLLRQADAPHVLCVVSHRSEGMQDNPQLQPLYDHLPDDIRVDCRQLTLGPLPLPAALQLAGRRGEALVHEAGGNPFLLTELARADATESGSLADALRRRVARLTGPARALLEVLAVCGRRTELAIAGQAAGVGDGAHAAFDALRSALLARATNLPGRVECYHDKIRESVLAALDPARQRAIHRAMADALLASRDPDPEHLAMHFERAGERRLAAPYAVLAAQRAEAALAFRRAAELYQLALDGGEHDPEQLHDLRVARARALDGAGLGVAAGDAYLEAMTGAPPEQANQLKQRAARLYLLAGHMQQGRALLLEALAELGIDTPSSTAGVFAGYAYHQTRLRLGGIGFKDRGPADPRTAARIAALVDAADSLGRTDQFLSFYFAVRALREALRAGDPAYVALCIAWEVFSGAFMAGAPVRLSSSVGALRRMFERGVELAGQTGNLRALDNLMLGRAHLEFMAANDAPAAVDYFDRMLALHREHSLPNASFNLAWARSNRCLVRGVFQGEFAEVAAELPALIDEGWARNDLSVTPFMAGTHMTVRLACEDLAAARRDLDRARSAWSSPTYTIQDHAMDAGEMLLLLYLGEPTRVVELYDRAWSRLRQSTLRHVPHLVALLGYPFGSALVRLALASQRGEHRQELLRRAEEVCRPLSRLQPPFNAVPTMVVSAVAAARGERERAERLAAPVLTSGNPPGFPEAVHRALGAWIGGERGEAMIAQAETDLRALGVVDPARFANVVAPFRP